VDSGGAFVQIRLTNIWCAIGVSLDLFAYPFKTFAAHILESSAIGTKRRAFVKIDGNRKFLPDASSRFMCKRHAFIHCYPAYRDERQDVSRANTRMHSRVIAQVN